ncbi:hypothetical protein ACWF94_35025 [Streptomyces sp. NPDC055078]
MPRYAFTAAPPAVAGTPKAAVFLAADDAAAAIAAVAAVLDGARS